MSRENERQERKKEWKKKKTTAEKSKSNRVCCFLIEWTSHVKNQMAETERENVGNIIW